MALPGTALYDSSGNPALNTTNTAVSVSATSATVKATPGRLFAVTVTTTGANPLSITDGPGGPSIFQFAASPALGTYAVGVNGNVFNTSLVVVGSATNPAVTLHYA